MNTIRFDFHRQEIYIFHQFWPMCKHFSKRTSKAGKFWPPVGGAINMTQKLYVDVVIASITLILKKKTLGDYLVVSRYHQIIKIKWLGHEGCEQNISRK